MQCIVVKSDEFENSSPLYIFPLNPDYVAARSLRSLRSNQNITFQSKRVVGFSRFWGFFFATNAMQGILSAVTLFFVRVLSNQSVKQSISLFKSQWYVAKGKTLYLLGTLKVKKIVEDMMICSLDGTRRQDQMISWKLVTTRNFSTTNLSSFILVFFFFQKHECCPS